MAASYRVGRSSLCRFAARVAAIYCCAWLTSFVWAESVVDYDPFEHFDPFGEAQSAQGGVQPVAHLERSTVTFHDQRSADTTMLQLSDESPARSTIAFQIQEPTTFQNRNQTIKPALQLNEDLPTPVAPPRPLPGTTPNSAATNNERPDPDVRDVNVPSKPLCQLTTNIATPQGLLPDNYADDRVIYVPDCFDPCARTRCWPVTPFNWEASCLAHNPLYFEEPNLERYGYGCGCYGPCCSTCVQSVVSGAHFFGSVPALPYMMATDCPGDCVYTLGNYRPGSCPPWRYTCCTRPSCPGGWATAGVATGIIFLIP